MRFFLVVALLPAFLLGQRLSTTVTPGESVDFRFSHPNLRLKLTHHRQTLGVSFQFHAGSLYLATGALDMQRVLPWLANKKLPLGLLSSAKNALRKPWPTGQTPATTSMVIALWPDEHRPLGFSGGQLTKGQVSSNWYLLHFFPSSFPWQLDLQYADSSGAERRQNRWLRRPGEQPDTSRQHYALSSQLRGENFQWDFTLARAVGGWHHPSLHQHTQLKLRIPLPEPHQLLTTLLLFQRGKWYQDFRGRSTLYRRQWAVRAHYRLASWLTLDASGGWYTFHDRDFYSQHRVDTKFQAALTLGAWQWRSTSGIDFKKKEINWKQILSVGLTLSDWSFRIRTSVQQKGTRWRGDLAIRGPLRAPQLWFQLQPDFALSPQRDRTHRLELGQKFGIVFKTGAVSSSLRIHAKKWLPAQQRGPEWKLQSTFTLRFDSLKTPSDPWETVDEQASVEEDDDPPS